MVAAACRGASPADGRGPLAPPFTSGTAKRWASDVSSRCISLGIWVGPRGASRDVVNSGAASAADSNRIEQAGLRARFAAHPFRRLLQGDHDGRIKDDPFTR